MSAHTPGPWVAHYSDKFDNYQIFGAGKTGLRPWICNTKCESVPAHHDANARLIAAAPRLLEELQRLVNIADSGLFRDRAELSIATHPAYDDARELIKSITGETK